MQSPIGNDCLKVKIDGHTEPQLVPKLLLRVYSRELHNKLVSDSDNGGLKEARDEDDNIIISESTLRSLLPPQFKQISSRYKFMCGCECCISAKIIHESLMSWQDRYLKKLRDHSQNSQNRKSGVKANCIYGTYKNKVMPHWCHIYPKEYDMAKTILCA